MAQEQNFNKSFNALRFFAMMLVFFAHCQSFFGQTSIAGNFIWKSLGNAGVGVSFFVLLSGFMIAMKYIDFFQNFSREEYFGYIKKRLKSFYIVYLISILINVPFMWQYILEQPLINLTKLILQLSLVQAVLPMSVAWAYNSCAWTLSSLFLIYLVSPWVIQLVATIEEKWQVRGILISLAMLWGVFSAFSFLPVYGNLAQYLFYYSPFYRILEFSSGALLYLFLMKTQMSSRLLGKMEIPICIAVLIFISYGPSFLPTHLKMGWGYVPILLCLIAVFYNQQGIISKFLSNPFLQKMGSLSLGFYLMHYAFTKCCYEILENFDLKGNTWIALTALVIVWVLSVASAAIVQKINRMFFQLKRENPREELCDS
ncbi:acyltransferase family protein [Desulfosediminicola flagellatus]|uniref:acyltransferase family protein n=1 Tax=Desulfosediminicola flagellatus TaxID=2569541 RepID=UPI0010AB5ECC|nr:acyltransferase [Desulfosediminicola flagellatus]